MAEVLQRAKAHLTSCPGSPFTPCSPAAESINIDDSDDELRTSDRYSGAPSTPLGTFPSGCEVGSGASEAADHGAATEQQQVVREASIPYLRM